jgi:hypothetical protein
VIHEVQPAKPDAAILSNGESAMVVFEVSVNGKRAFTMGAGEFGMLTASVMWDRIQTNAGPIHEAIRLSGRGLEPPAGKHLSWSDQSLKMGDEITIRIVDSTTFDEPAERFALEEKRAELESKMRKPNSN